MIAGVVRFGGLDRPTDGGTPVFDEKHYVPQAWQMLRDGGVEVVVCGVVCAESGFYFLTPDVRFPG